MSSEDPEARTNKLRDALGFMPPQKPVRVICSGTKEFLSNPIGQFILVSIVNSISRIGVAYRWPELDIPGNVPCRLPWLGNGSLQDEVVNWLAKIWGGSPKFSEGAIDYKIVIGKAANLTKDSSRTISCGADGWTAYWGGIASPLTSSVAPSAAARAAAGAVARLFSNAEGSNSLGELVAFSVIDHGVGKCAEDYSGKFNVENHEWLIAGCGALGQGVAWTLSLEPGSPKVIRLFDDKNLKMSNLNRYMWSTTGQVEAHVSKAETLSNSFKILGWNAEANPTPIDQWEPNGPLVLAFTALDDSPPRRTVQKELPPWLINGGTSDETYTISRHWADNILAGEPCLGCLYPSTESRPVSCDQQRLSQVGLEAPSISFLSLACGAEMVAEAELIAAGLRRKSGAWQQNIFTESLAVPTLPQRRPSCGICNDPILSDLWRKAALYRLKSAGN